MMTRKLLLTSPKISHLGSEISFKDNVKAELFEEGPQGIVVFVCPLSVSKLHVVCSRLLEILITQQQTYPSHWLVHRVRLKSNGIMRVNASTASNVKGEVN